mgnify:CR=1 FL=1
MFDREKIKKGVELILEGIGEDKTREGLVETPDRIARMYEEIFAGLEQDTEEILSKTFSVENNEMVIEKDRRHLCCYTTPYGELMMGIYAKTVLNEIGEHGGTLKFAYTIDFNNTPASENELQITVAAKTQEE